MRLRSSSEMSLENHGLIAIHKNAVFYMRPNRARQHHLFQIASLADQVLDSIPVGNSHNVLLDDGAIIEDFRHAVAGSTDKLHSAFKCLVVGARTHESRQKRMVDVDNAPRIAINKFV